MGLTDRKTCLFLLYSRGHWSCDQTQEPTAEKMRKAAKRRCFIVVPQLARISHKPVGRQQANAHQCRNFGRKLAGGQNARLYLTMFGVCAVPAVSCDLVAGLP